MLIAITSFDGPNRFLSNFYEHRMVSPVDDLEYPSSEHAYQAAKTIHSDQKYEIQAAPGPGAAKRLGRHVELRPGWEQIKDDCMRRIVRAKFSDPSLRSVLLQTGDAFLIEGNTWGDKYWGCINIFGGWHGQNRLGQILMEIRKELRS